MSSTDVNNAKPGQPVVRDEGGRWVVPPKGGRPKGLTQSEKIRALLEPERDRLVGKLLELCNNDDPLARSSQVRAIELALARLGPPPKQASETIEVPGLAEAQGFAAKCECIIAAVSHGHVSAEAGERVLRLLDVYRKAVEHDQLAARIEALERGKRAKTIEIKPEQPGVGDLL